MFHVRPFAADEAARPPRSPASTLSPVGAAGRNVIMMNARRRSPARFLDRRQAEVNRTPRPGQPLALPMLLGRLGGEEFAILLPAIAPEEAERAEPGRGGSPAGGQRGPGRPGNGRVDRH